MSAESLEAGARIEERRQRIIAAALDNARHGLPQVVLFGIVANGCACGDPDCGKNAGKHPVHAGWQKAASTDPAVVRAMFSCVELEVNAGFATGRESRIVVIDIDGVDGEHALEALEAKHGYLPATWTVRTARGRHLYFRVSANAGIRNSASKLGKGLDVRGDGGYVVAAGSRHASGFTYCWDVERGPDDLVIGPLPAWVIELLVKPVVSLVPPAQTLPPAPGERAERWARAALEREVAAVRGATEGTRNTQLRASSFKCGARVVASGRDAEDVKGALLVAALECGLSERESLKTIRAGIADGMKEPCSGPTRDRPRASAGSDAAAAPHGRSNGASATGHHAASGGDGGGEEPPGPEHEEPKAEPRAPRYSLISTAIADQLRPVGPRLSTGITTLDKALRGGLPMGTLVIVQGAPGTGKTTWLVELLFRWTMDGVPCVWLAADEAPAGIITRFGQLVGLSRASLESEHEDGTAARKSFAEACEGQPAVVLDPDDDESDAKTIEDAERVLMHMAPEGERVLFVDSLQVVRCAAADHIEGIRERITAKVEALRAIAKRGTLVIAISEVARGAYRSKDRSQNADSLSWGKESGAIEFRAAVLISLSSVKDAAGLIDVEISKNRLGQKLPFRLQQDFERASFTEVALPKDTEGESDRTTAARTAAMRRVRDAVLGNLKLTSQCDVLALCKGSRDHNANAFRAMHLRGELVVNDEGYLRLKSPPADRSP